MTLLNKPITECCFSERSQLTQNLFSKICLKRMEEKKSNLCISFDLTSSKDILNLVKELGPYMIMAKTHIDIIEDYSPEFILKLREYANKFGFFIFEDRKFADIGQTVKNQFSKGLYKISSWSDLTNAHIIPGPGIIDGLYQSIQENNITDPRGLLLLAQMSSKGAFNSDQYIQNTLNMAVNNKNYVSGFIAQSRFENSEPGFLYLTPGVHLNDSSDALGQQYRSPEHAIVVQGCDLIIVGRGVIENVSPNSIAKNYRNQGWEGYLSRIKTH